MKKYLIWGVLLVALLVVPAAAVLAPNEAQVVGSIDSLFAVTVTPQSLDLQTMLIGSCYDNANAGLKFTATVDNTLEPNWKLQVADDVSGSTHPGHMVDGNTAKFLTNAMQVYKTWIPAWEDITGTQATYSINSGTGTGMQIETDLTQCVVNTDVAGDYGIILDVKLVAA
ncbi:MAG: hypothetical protein LUQ67_06155 [Methanomicrobiales archaeon]|nr:hypothetical protein [Methanomicrobiales archaeon]